MCEARLANDDQLLLAIFCIDAVAERSGMDTRDVYRMLADETNLLDDYIARYYDALHTQDKYYIAEDVIRELASDGIYV